VRGRADEAELAAVIAAISAARAAPQPDSYARWRRQRLAAIHPA
jgi:hypothetical protein